MKTIEEIIASNRVIIERLGEDGGIGWVPLSTTKKSAAVIFSYGCGWDHVSVSYRDRCPTWDEMCMVKDIFFNNDECVVQYHPPKQDYVNNHPYCLHLWKPQEQEIPRPPKCMVG